MSAASFSSSLDSAQRMFSFFKKKTPAETALADPGLPERGWRERLGCGTTPPAAPEAPRPEPAPVQAAPAPVEPEAPPPERITWLNKLRAGLRKTGTSIAQVFTGTQIDDAL